mgnify:FL=1
MLLKGEISNFKHHSRGHFYFTLKDDKAQISAIMFASNSQNVVFKPENGMSILVEGYLTVYEASGQYQIYVKKMDEDGVGSLHVAYEQLKKKLQEEGLFDQKHKQAIPKFPSTIAVLTSPTGAAVKDIINIVNRRYPIAKIIVYPTLVQGEFAKDNIVNNLKQVNKHGKADVIILGRGGGSIEDLWPFNEEAVAYEIFKSTIPIISSVGHETDSTIADFVADLRAPTPSGGAELAVPDQYELFNYLKQLESASKVSLKRLLSLKKERLSRLKSSYVFKDPLRLTESKSRRYDHLKDKLELLSPINRITQSIDKVDHLTMSLNSYFERYLTKRQNDYVISINKLELLNPLNIMKKGYSVTRKNGKILKSISQINKNDELDILMNDGSLKAIVKEINKGE